MIILGIDTSNSQGQLCLLKDNKLIYEKKWIKEGSHSELITDKFTEALSQAELKTSDIEEIYCAVGPGSFTGIRVGVSFCKSLAFSHDIPIIPVNSLMALAMSFEKNGLITCLIDAQKNTVFFSQFEKSGSKLQTLHENRIVPVKDLNQFVKSDTICCGDGFGRYKEYFSNDLKSFLNQDMETDFMDLTRVIHLNSKENYFEPSRWQNLQPLYIRPSSAEEKLGI